MNLQNYISEAISTGKHKAKNPNELYMTMSLDDAVDAINDRTGKTMRLYSHSKDRDIYNPKDDEIIVDNKSYASFIVMVFRMSYTMYILAFSSSTNELVAACDIFAKDGVLVHKVNPSFDNGAVQKTLNQLNNWFNLRDDVNEAVSTGKHRKDYSPSVPEDIDDTITLEEFISLLERMKYTEVDKNSDVISMFDRLGYPIYRVRKIDHNPIRVLVKNNKRVKDEYYRVQFDEHDHTLKTVEYVYDRRGETKAEMSDLRSLIEYLK